MSKIKCPYCNAKAKLSQNLYGPIWLCQPCDAWVGCHRGTTKPLGRLANWELRNAKMAAHGAFDPLWKLGFFQRRDAYVWLAKQLGIPTDSCHIGEFDVANCERVYLICTDYLAERDCKTDCQASGHDPV